MSRSRYPHFDVMEQFDAWDPHTQSVVRSRFQAPDSLSFLTEHEAQMLRCVAAHLLYENRAKLLSFVVHHFDQQLATKIGESEREQNVPAEADLIRWGLAALDAVARHLHGVPFLECDTDQQFQLIARLQRGEWRTEEILEAAGLPQKAFFRKLLGLAVEALASHPAIWSEIGYAGPAYPRGYYRIERGVTDPWEPKATPNARR